MSPPARPPSAVLVSARSALRGEVARALGGSATLLDGEAGAADVAVLDLTGDGAKAALDKLRRERPATPVIGLVENAASANAVDLDIADFVALDRLAEELPLRIRQAQTRHASWREAQQREKDLSLLLRLTADYAEALDVGKLLHDVTRRLAEEMDITRAALIVLDEQRDAGFIIAASDDAALKDHRIELSRYPEIREVVRTGKPVIVDDAPAHPLLEGVKEQVAARGIFSIAALPLTVQNKVLGVLLLRASAQRRAFSLREIDFLSTVAHATAVALRNARLLESERDQTEREKHARIAAEERAAELARYESYFEHLSEGVAIVDAKSCVLSVNPAGAQLLDVGRQEARGRHIHALTNPTDDGIVMEMLLSVSRGEVIRSRDLPIRTLAGRKLILSVSAAPLREVRDAAAILSFRDVTAEKLLADELRKTKEFLERLIDSSVDAIIAADLKGKIILYNKGAEAICGYPPDEALAKLHVKDLYPPGVARDVMIKLRDPGAGGGKGRLGATRQEIISKRGTRVPVNMTASIVYEGNREVATLGVFTDLRDRVDLEMKLSAAEEWLDEAEKNAVIVALAGTAAHELNQPLTSVMGYAELLKRKLKEGDFAFRPVDIIFREAERMAEIVRKIGKITRYETKAYIGAAKILDLDKATSHED